jgi:hypothetical protein
MSTLELFLCDDPNAVVLLTTPTSIDSLLTACFTTMTIDDDGDDT